MLVVPNRSMSCTTYRKFLSSCRSLFLVLNYRFWWIIGGLIPQHDNEVHNRRAPAVWNTFGKSSPNFDKIRSCHFFFLPTFSITPKHILLFACCLDHFAVLQWTQKKNNVHNCRVCPIWITFFKSSPTLFALSALLPSSMACSRSSCACIAPCSCFSRASTLASTVTARSSCFRRASFLQLSRPLRNPAMLCSRWFVYTYMHIYMHLHICPYAPKYKHSFICMHQHNIHVHTFTFTYTNAHICHTYAHIGTMHTHAHKNTHIHTLIHTCTHTHIRIFTQILLLWALMHMCTRSYIHI